MTEESPRAFSREHTSWCIKITPKVHNYHLDMGGFGVMAVRKGYVTLVIKKVYVDIEERDG